MGVIVVTGSAGLIGSEATRWFHNRGFDIVGIDNDMRAWFFGPEASTAGTRALLEARLNRYLHQAIDIRNTEAVDNLFARFGIAIKGVIHAAAQPSHDWAARDPFSILAERNREFLFRWMDPNFNKLKMLKEANVGVFALIKEDPIISKIEILQEASVHQQINYQPTSSTTEHSAVTQEYRYYNMEAGEVYFLWGINGWQPAPDIFRPIGTTIKGLLMHTPMARVGDLFNVEIRVPADTAVDYCFLITKKRDSFDITWPFCDGNYRDILLENGVKNISNKLALDLINKDIRYYMPEASQVDLSWGLNNWHVLPEELRPPGTELKNKIMHTPMLQEGQSFFANIQVPVDATINYAFRITKRRGIFDIVYPILYGNYQDIVKNNYIIERIGSMNLFGDLSKMRFGLYLLFVIILIFSIAVIINRIHQRYGSD